MTAVGDSGLEADAGGDGGVTDTGWAAPWAPFPAGRCPVGERPKEIPSSWQRYDGVACDCPLYTEGPTGERHALEWEACPPPILQETGCRRLKDDGEWALHLGSIWHDDSSRRTFVQMVSAGSFSDPLMYVVAEIDGPVRHSLLRLRGASCELVNDVGLRDGRFLLSLLRPNSEGVEGVLGGRIEEPYPSLVYLDTASHPRLLSDWAPSSSYVVRYRETLQAYDWEGRPVATLYDPAEHPGYPAMFGLCATGTNVFLSVGDHHRNGTLSFSLARGLDDFLFWPNDPTRGTASFGTDGNTMVWTYGEGRDPGVYDDRYLRYSVMTAPFTADGAQALASARRLRSDPGFSPLNRFGVGCGYAARVTPMLELLIVRLSDGMSWLLPSAATTKPSDWQWQKPGFACAGDEVDLIVQLANLKQWDASRSMWLVRIPVAGLGPAMPPD